MRTTAARKVRSRKPRLAGRRLSARQLRSTAIHGLKQLPPEKLKVAAQFLVFLEYGASDEATAELLGIPGILDGLREAYKEIAAGKAVSWRGSPRPPRRRADAES